MYNVNTLLFEVSIMMTRYSSAVGMGAIATFALLFLMQALIVLQPGVYSEPRPRSKIQIVRIKPDEEVRTRDIPRPDAALKTPEPLPRRTVAEYGDELSIARPVPPPAAPTGSRAITALRMTDGPLVAIVRVQPVYPAVAEARGLEGWALIEFDVLPDGRVANAFVVDSSSQLFEKAALSAAYRFRYKPRVVDGEPITTSGIQNLFRFEMPDR
jgi:protein TonB